MILMLLMEERCVLPIFMRVCKSLYRHTYEKFEFFNSTEQARLDGAFCDFSESDKMTFLRNLQKNGVVNIEMEAIPFAAMTYEAGIRAADLCVTFLDRLQGDQVIGSDVHYSIQRI